MLLTIISRCSSWCSKLNSNDICCCATKHSVTIILRVLLYWERGRLGGGGWSCLTPLNPNINKQIVQTVLKHILKGLFENNFVHDQSIYSIGIFLTILITFSFLWCCDDVSRKSLLVTQSGGRGGFMIREATLAYVNRDTTTVVSQIKLSQSLKKKCKNIKLQKTRSYFMCHLSRSCYVKKAKTDRDLSAKHEGQWLVLQKSEL